ncbi:MAG: 4Fe-4S dicluster domain-containing protein [Magnetococcales bacterium]|nr:4Fe-4S dicluster domain-containing protein [Magnetococcales bacterium]
MAYDLSFAKDVYENAEEGHWIKMCMQCGVCAGSCPLGPHWEFSPRQLFQMIRAGKAEEVLKSESMWMCVSCYHCMVRCPRGLPITHIVHGLARFAVEKKRADKDQVTRRFAKILWENMERGGRIGEMALTTKLYMVNGIPDGVKKGMEMKDQAMSMLKSGRLKMDPLHLSRIRGHAGFKAMLKKAREIEQKKRES